jgi:hypothetical protein
MIERIGEPQSLIEISLRALVRGSVSAKAGAEVATLISARGTSVCARRSNMFGAPVAAVVVQTEKS